MLSKGGKATLIIPSTLGYGDRPAGKKIPPYAPLVFEVELVDIIKGNGPAPAPQMPQMGLPTQVRTQ